MTTTFQRSGKERIEDRRCFRGVNETSRHHQDIGIVVLTRQTGDFGNPAQSSTYGRMLVERHGDAFSATANGNTAFALPTIDGSTEGVSEIGIVAGI